MTQVTEKALFTTTSNFPDTTIPTSFFENQLPIRLMKLLSVIDYINDQIGKEVYMIEVNDIMNRVNQKLEEDAIPNESTMYRYLRRSETSGLLRGKRISVKLFHEVDIKQPAKDEHPNIFVKDRDGKFMTPDEITSGENRFFLEDGEKNIKFYELTDKGKEILELSKGGKKLE